MTAEETVFYSIAGKPPLGTARGRTFRRATGALAFVTQLVGAVEQHRLDVQVVEFSDHGIGLRGPIGLARGAIYRVQMGYDPNAHSHHVRIVSSRRRPDGNYDIAARNIWDGSAAEARCVRDPSCIGTTRVRVNSAAA